MPVLQISALPTPGVDVDEVLATVCRELASELGEEPSGTWATWHTVTYAEGGDVRHEQPRDTHPPLVRVIAFEGKPPELVARMLDCVAAVLARELRLEPGNVFVLYEEARPGRLHTGGQLAE